MDYFEYGDFSGLYDLFQSILALGALLVIVGIAAAIAVYLYAGYVLMCIYKSLSVQQAGLQRKKLCCARWYSWIAFLH